MEPTHSIRILYIEDDPGLARLVQKRLGKAGYTVDIAVDGEQGIAKYEADAYDVVFVDQSLPIYDGLQVIRILASRGPLPPIVMVTGTGDEKVAVEAMKLGTSDYIVKDVEGGYLNLLPSVIEKVLQQRRAIEQKKQAEASLLESEEKYRNLVERANDGIVVIQDGIIKYANPYSAQIWGGSPEELCNTPFADHIDPDELSQVVDHYNRRMKGEDVPSKYKTVLRGKDGGKIYVEINAGTITYQGKLADLVFTRNISERKRMELKLQESEQRYRILVDNIGLGINLIDADYTIVMANAAQSKHSNKTVDELIGKKCFQEFEKRDAVCPHCPGVQAMATGRPAEVETEVVGDDGSPYDVRIQAYPFFGGDGTVRSFIEIAEDITERKVIEKALINHKETLQHSFFGIAEALSKVIEDRDPYTSGHSLGVAGLAEAIARRMGFPEDESTGVYIAGILHDIGKMAVPVEILAKPGRLNAMEISLIQMHPQAGYEILKGIEFPWPVAQATLQHHERIDGSGYPQGLKGDMIIPEARILAVADVMDAMTHHRPYRPGFTLQTAVEDIRQGRGRLYDPQVVDTCVEILGGKPPFVISEYSTTSTSPQLRSRSTNASALPTTTMVRASGRR
jgi:PAS domain S-box-containing protein/putative nucleotidyltransferase with HDIG domain